MLCIPRSGIIHQSLRPLLLGYGNTDVSGSVSLRDDYSIATAYTWVSYLSRIPANPEATNTLPECNPFFFGRCLEQNKRNDPFFITEATNSSLVLSLPPMRQEYQHTTMIWCNGIGKKEAWHKIEKKWKKLQCPRLCHSDLFASWIKSIQRELWGGACGCLSLSLHPSRSLLA